MNRILKIGLLIFNIFVFIGSIVICYMFSDKISLVSHQFMTLITPINATFAIWGLIYSIALFCNLYFFIDPNFQIKFVFIQMALFLLNALWAVFWSNYYMILSWITILMIWVLLLYTIINISREYTVNKVLKEYFFMYFAWISVAASINTGVVLIDMGLPGAFSWGILSVCNLGILSVVINRKQDVILCSLTIIWALVGIFFQPVILFPFFQNFRYLILAVVCLLTLDFFLQWYLKLKKATD
ncbi:MAG: hypothetical protein ACRCWI_08760 [Brevinema sp.]